VGTSKPSVVETNVSQSAESKASLAEVGLMAPSPLLGGKDHKVKLWDARTAKCLDTIHGHKNTMRCCAWTNNGNSFVTGGSDQKLKLYDLRRTSESFMTWSCQAPMGIGNKTNEMTAVAMHPHDETLFASGDYHFFPPSFFHTISLSPAFTSA
jgi:WD40 repeat protein